MEITHIALKARCTQFIRLQSMAGANMARFLNKMPARAKEGTLAVGSEDGAGVPEMRAR